MNSEESLRREDGSRGGQQGKGRQIAHAFLPGQNVDLMQVLTSRTDERVQEWGTWLWSDAEVMGLYTTNAWKAPEDTHGFEYTN